MREVRISNSFVQQFMTDFGVVEYRLFFHILDQINKFNDPSKKYSYSIDELCKCIGYNPKDQRSARQKVKTLLKRMGDRSIYTPIKRGSETGEALTRIFGKVNVFKKEVEIILDEDFIPFAFNLEGNYLRINPDVTNVIDGVLTMRLYLLMKSFSNIGRRYMSIYELGQRLYRQTPGKDGTETNNIPAARFMLRDLKSACRRLTDLTDLTIEMETRAGKRGKIEGIDFKIEVNEQPYYLGNDSTNRSKAKRANDVEKTIKAKAAAETQKRNLHRIEHGVIDLNAIGAECPEAAPALAILKMGNIADEALIKYIKRNFHAVEPAVKSLERFLLNECAFDI